MGMGPGGMGPVMDNMMANNQANGHFNMQGAVDMGGNPHGNGLNPINNQKLTQMLDN